MELGVIVRKRISYEDIAKIWVGGQLAWTRMVAAAKTEE